MHPSEDRRVITFDFILFYFISNRKQVSTLVIFILFATSSLFLNALMFVLLLFHKRVSHHIDIK